MNKSKFLKLLRSFTSEELKSFNKFIRSPYFNTNKSIISLFNFLKINSGNFILIDENRIFRHIYPGKQFNRKRLRELSSQMLSLCEMFLSVQNFKSSDFDVKLNLLKSLNPRAIQDHFLNNYRLIENNTKTGIINYDHYNKLIILKKELFKFYNTYNFKAASQDSEAIVNDVAKAVTFEILRCSIALETIHTEFGSEYEKFITEDFLLVAEKYHFFNDSIIEIYYNLWLLTSRKDHNAYNKIISMYELNKSRMHIDIKKEIYLSLHNFIGYNGHLVKGFNIKEEIYRVLYVIYNEKLMYDVNGYLILNFFHNYLDTLIDLDKISEAEDFININKSELGYEKLNLDTINYFYAKISFKKNNFRSALSYLDKVSNSDLKLTTIKKFLQTVCLYEEKEFDKLMQVLSSYTRYLNRKLPVSSQFILRYKTISDHFNSFLVNYDNKNKLKIILSVLRSIERYPYRLWLISKIESRLQDLK